MNPKSMLSVFVLLVMIVSVFCLPGIALAADEVPPETTTTVPASGPDTVTLSTTYPKIEALANAPFQFSITLNFKGSTERVFDLKVITPQGWISTLTPLYETNKIISSITMEASETGRAQSLQLTVGASTYQPEPGDYTITLEAASGDLVGKIDLTAKVTERYSLYAEPVDGLYSLTAKSGKDNIYTISVTNEGTAAIENITFVSDKTQGWEISFSTDSIARLEAGATNTVDVNIRPAEKTVSGDYKVKIWINGKQASMPGNLEVRVTVETSSVWGAVGVAIILIVVVGLIFTFVRFGRR